MHVSNKIAFRLDDVFFKALDQAEYVALESDPNLWLDYYKDSPLSIDFNNYDRGTTYKSVVIELPKLTQVATTLGIDNSMINNILYRTNVFAQNFQDETYLDMFIYQACKKGNKQFVPLEDLKESDSLMNLINEDDIKKIPDEWLKTRMEKNNENYGELIENAYRERNIYLIDSLQKALYEFNYLKYMLYERNKVMAKGIISTIQKGSTFTGIGAAHLAGEDGVIQLLRDAGYTLTPITSEKSKIGTNIKAKFEDTFVPIQLQETASEDSIITLKLPTKLYNFGQSTNGIYYASPDLTNGSYISLLRHSKFNYIPSTDSITLAKLQDLFFEAIPGVIISKKELDTKPYMGLEIISKLKNGDYQRFHLYETPTEIFILKMSGKKDFVLNYSNEIFNSVTFKTPHNTWETITDYNESFEVLMPDDYAFYNPNHTGQKLLQAYDQATGAYYIVENISLHDYDYIEEDYFELKHLQRRFYEALNSTPSYNDVALQNNHPMLTSSGIIDSTTNAKLYVATTLNKDNYYLMAAFNSSVDDANTFFNSFKTKEPSYQKAYEKVKDTGLCFTTLTTIKLPPNYKKSNYNNGYFNKKRDHDYEGYILKNNYRNDSNEAIEVKRIRLPDYQMYNNINSLWDTEFSLPKYRTFIQENLPVRTQEGTDYYTEERTLTDTLSSRAIYIKRVYKQGNIYILSTVTDTLNTPTKYVTEFYNNFTPFDSLEGKSPFEDKTPLFFEKLRANDTIVTEIYNQIVFSDKHLDSLFYYVSNFNFSKKQEAIKHMFIRSIATSNDKRVKPFLKKLYIDSYHDSYIQGYILNTLAEKENEETVKDILALLEADFPVKTIIKENFIATISDSLSLSKELFPELLDYALVENYKLPVSKLLSQLVLQKKIKSKMYKHLIGQFLNEANIELKKDYKGFNGYKSYSSYKESLLPSYITLLYPYKKQQKISDFFKKIEQSDNTYFKIVYQLINKKLGEPVNSNYFISYAKSEKTRQILYELMDEYELLNLFPREYFQQDSLNIGYLFRNLSSNVEIKSYEQVTKQCITNKSGKFMVYIYKVIYKYSSGTENKKLKALYIPESENPSLEFIDYTSKLINTYTSEEKLIKNILEEIEFEDRERIKNFY
ncbi:hypothetical protein NBRC110019_21730 [Neptunitalea chrysea]|uniref:TraB/GumN family protein n=2 Tax=Neptunitalea chrysea TaxID=1647581 RepID=A0A9W6B5Q8_9FLAO|nr:hypothetical protein NBRC110019_21730 [Neptunitalea chrysea]